MGECDLPVFHSWSEPIAKKQHKCCECSAPILIGEKHYRGTGKWDGKISSFRQHLTCMEACMMIRDEFNGGDCIAFGELKEAFHEIKIDNWYPERDRYKASWKKLRHLMAVIFVRERKQRKSA